MLYALAAFCVGYGVGLWRGRALAADAYDNGVGAGFETARELWLEDKLS